MNILNGTPTAEDILRQSFEDGIRKLDPRALFINRYPENDADEKYRGRYMNHHTQAMWEGFQMHAAIVPEPKILKAVKHTPEGLTVAELKEVIKDWPDLDGDGQPCQVWIGDGNSPGISNPARSVCSLNVCHVFGRQWADMLIDS